MKWLKNWTRSPKPTVRRKAKAALGVESLEGRNLMAADALPVLLVIADQQDFYYQEYGDTRLAIEAQGVPVQVAATTTNPSRPHAGTGEPAGTDGTVIPDIALTDVDPANYSAIAFVGGWGSSMYQYAFQGTYIDGRYNGDLATKEVVNDLIGDFLAEDKQVAAICHGTTVLAWARVDGVSPIAGKEVATPFIGSPAVNYQGQFIGYFGLPQNGQIAANGGIPSAYSGARGLDPTTVADDVVVDGRIITAENYDAAYQFGTIVAQEVIASAASDPTPDPEPVNHTPIVENQVFSMQENSVVGTVAGVLLAHDEDVGQTHTFAIVAGNVNNAFAIDPTTGTVTVANSAALDFETNPSFGLTIAVTDNGATPLTAAAEMTINLLDVYEAPQPGIFFNGSELLVQGTAGTDYIYVWSGAASSQVYAWMNGQFAGPFNIPNGGHVRVFAGGSNDYIYATDARIGVEIHSEDGHDVVTGGSGNDLLVGGNGTDRISGNQGNDLIRGGGGSDYLYGNAGDDIVLGDSGDDYLEGSVGRDILIGGTGIDRAFGGSGEDLLIGGTTSYDNNDAALLAVQAAWLATDSLATRAIRLANDVGNGIRLAIGQTVHDDSANDVLCGGEEADLVFANYLDYFCNDPADKLTTA